MAGSSRFALIVRVPVLAGRTLTPDLADSHTRLYEWSDGA
jgi:hypothetical protein